MSIHLGTRELSVSISERSGSILPVEDANGLRLMKSARPDLPLWCLYLVDSSTGQVGEWTSWTEFAVSTRRLAGDGERVDLLWQLMPGLEINASLELLPSSPNLYLRVEVRNSTEAAIQQVEFPLLRGIGRLTESPAESNLLLHPVAGGFLFVDPYSSFPKWTTTHGLRHIAYLTDGASRINTVVFGSP